VPSIPANGEATVYMYYGNPNATSNSNGEDVFLLFNNLNLDSTNGDYSETDEYYWTHVPASPGKYVDFKSTSSFSPPVVLEAEFKLTHWYESSSGGGGHTAIGFGDIGYNGFGSNGVWYDEMSGNANERGSYFCSRASGSNTCDHFSTTIDTSKKKVKIIWTATEVKLYFDDTLKSTITTNIPTVALPVTFGSWTNTDVGYESGGCAFKDVLVRKYTSPEPTYRVGPEIWL